MAGELFDDPNRQSVGLVPIWTGADDETPPATQATEVTETPLVVDASA